MNKNLESVTKIFWGKSSRSNHEYQFLQGPHKILPDIVRILRIMIEFVKGYFKFYSLGTSVIIFGSARLKYDNKYYKMAKETGECLAKAGLAVMTGGGPGIMEAANKGAKEIGGLSLGCNITLPEEQEPNSYLDFFIEFHHFFVRKVIEAKYSSACIAFPGGFGTMDELFELLTLVQTGKMKNFPIVLMGKDYWKNIVDLFNMMVTEGTLSQKDFKYFIITDDPNEAICYILNTIRS